MTVNAIKIPVIAYDGGQVDTLWDNHEPAIEWYEKHMDVVPRIRADKVNFRFDKSSDSEMMSFYSDVFNLHSVLTSKRLVHLYADRGTVDSNLRWCFQTKDLDAEHKHMNDNRIRISDIYTGPGEKRYFDFWATAEGTRLTAVGAPELPDDAPRYSTACIRIGVSDLQQAAEWYRRFLGFAAMEQPLKQSWIQLNALTVEEVNGQRVSPIAKHYPIYLEKLPSDAAIGRVDGPARPYFLIEDRKEFEAYHQALQDNGIWVSPIGDGFGTFHTYDPDGNRLNFWHY